MPPASQLRSEPRLRASIPPNLTTSVQRFKHHAVELDRALVCGDGPTVEARSAGMKQEFETIVERLNAPGGLADREVQVVSRELLPYVLLGRATERAYTKPLGYGGDFATIDLIYRNQPHGAGRIGSAVDAMFLCQPAAKAVRNRRALVADEIHRELARHPDRDIRVMSVGSGPAREVLDAFEHTDARQRLNVTLLDMDPQALEHARQELRAVGMEGRVALLNANLIHLTLGRRRVSIPPQDFIYTIGLTDYLDDGLVIRFLDLAHSWLAPGGRVVVGNFHPRNPCRGLMDHLLGWKLIHRSEDDMHRLFRQSSFRAPCSRIVFEDEGINLFAECVKAESRT